MMATPFANIIRAIAANLGTVALGVGFLLDNGEGASGVVELGLDVREAINAGNDLGGVLAEAVQDDLERFLADFVGRIGDADRAFSGGEGLVAGQKSEAFGFFTQQHGGQITMAEANFAVIGDGTGDAERLQTDADGFGGVGSLGCALLDGNGSANDISPGRIFKGDRLDVFADLVRIDAFGFTNGLGFFDRGNAIFGKSRVDFVDAA